MKTGGAFRWVICGLLFGLVSLSYVDRLILGILKQPIGARLGWSQEDYGCIAAGFSFAYAFGYLLAGRAISRLGVRRGLPLFVGVWCAAVAAHGLISLVNPAAVLHARYPWYSRAEHGFQWLTLVMPMTAAGFVLARVVLGLAEGANFPAAIRVVAEWFPVRERAYATGWFNAGTNVGAVLCPLTVPWIYLRLGWPLTFYLTGLAGLVWLVAWWWLYAEPDRHPRLHPAELAGIRAGQPPASGPAAQVPWPALLRHRAVWAFLAASVLAGPAWGFYQFFVPDFLERRFQLTLQATGWWTGVFFGLTALGGISGGWLAGALLARGWRLNAARKGSLLLCALLVTPVCLAPLAGHVLLAVLIVGLAGAAHQGWSANLYSVVSDTLPPSAISSVVGLGGFACFFTGGFVNLITGMVLQRTGSYIAVFAWFSSAYLLAWLGLQILVPRIPDACPAPAPTRAADPRGNPLGCGRPAADELNPAL